MEVLYENLLNLSWQHVVMWIIGGILIYCAIKKDMEPTLLFTRWDWTKILTTSF